MREDPRPPKFRKLLFVSAEALCDEDELNFLCSFIAQSHSWSRLCVSAELMLQILVHHRISPVLLDFFHCFGLKLTGEDNPYYGTFHATIPPPGAIDSTSPDQHYSVTMYESWLKTSVYFVQASAITCADTKDMEMTS